MQGSIFPNAYFPDRAFGAAPTKAEIEAGLPRFRQPLADFIRALPAHARVLDAGCGAGKASVLTHALRPDIELHGVDISDVAGLLPAYVQFRRLSVEDLSSQYPTGFFDAVISLHVIEHLLYPTAMMAAARAALAPRGKLFIETPNWPRLFMPFSPLFFWNDYTHTRPFSPFSLNRLLRESGFIVERVLTRSSSAFLLKGDRQMRAKLRALTKPKPRDYRVCSRSRSAELAKALCRRLASPLFRDVLIAEARADSSV